VDRPPRALSRPVLRGNASHNDKPTGIWWVDKDHPPIIGPGNISDGQTLPITQ